MGGVLSKRKPTLETSEKKPELLRIEKKFIHGQWVDVKIYASNYQPDDSLKVNYNSKKKLFRSQTTGIGNDS
jgi:hypothetical protein